MTSRYEFGLPETAWWMPKIEDRGETILLEGIIRPGQWPSPEPLRLAVDGRLLATADYFETQGKNAINFRSCSSTNSGPTRNTKSTEASMAVRLKLK